MSGNNENNQQNNQEETKNQENRPQNPPPRPQPARDDPNVRFSPAYFRFQLDNFKF